MKNTFNPTILFLMIFGILLVSSCDMNEEPQEPNLAVVNEGVEVNMAFEDLDNLTLSVLSTSGLSARTSVNIPASNICAGAIVTLDESTKSVKINFGDGCTSTNGVIRKGIINLAYTGNLLITGAKITTTFENYEVNERKIEGTRILTNKGVSLENSTVTLEVKIQNGKVTWSDGSFVAITSDQLREIKLGTQGDYEASITGTASGTSRYGDLYTSSVTEPLIYKKNCLESGVKIPNSGILAFQYNEIEVTVDYGDGTCDKMATIFYPNGSKPVTLD